MNRKKLRANILLLLAALFWGSTFVAQRIAAGAIDPFPFVTPIAVAPSGSDAASL